MTQKLVFGSLFFLIAFTACDRHFQPRQLAYADYTIQGDSTSSTAISSLIRPYSDSMNRSMNTVIGYLETALQHRHPNSDLGNLVADAMLAGSSRVYGVKIDMAFVNFGGIRLPEIQAGPLTRGKIFELMPFDNLLLVQEVKGAVVKDLLGVLASRDGWPVAGITMEIRNGKAEQIRVGGKPLDENASYLVANSDYVINGGDNIEQLKSIPVRNKGYLVRDAIIEYVAGFQLRGEKLQQPTIRIRHAE